MPVRSLLVGIAVLAVAALGLVACRSAGNDRFTERHVEVRYAAVEAADADPQGADLVYEIQWFRRKFFTDPNSPGEEYEVGRVGPGPADDREFLVTFTPAPPGDLSSITLPFRTDGAGILRVTVPAEVKDFGKRGSGCAISIAGSDEGTTVQVEFDGAEPSFTAEQLVELIFTGR